MKGSIKEYNTVGREENRGGGPTWEETETELLIDAVDRDIDIDAVLASSVIAIEWLRRFRGGMIDQ